MGKNIMNEVIDFLYMQEGSRKINTMVLKYTVNELSAHLSNYSALIWDRLSIVLSGTHDTNYDNRVLSADDLARELHARIF